MIKEHIPEIAGAMALSVPMIGQLTASSPVSSWLIQLVIQLGMGAVVVLLLWKFLPDVLTMMKTMQTTIIDLQVKHLEHMAVREKEHRQDIERLVKELSDCNNCIKKESTK